MTLDESLQDVAKVMLTCALQELRDMNQVELTSDDKEKRWKEANAPNRVSACHHLIESTSERTSGCLLQLSRVSFRAASMS